MKKIAKTSNCSKKTNTFRAENVQRMPHSENVDKKDKRKSILKKKRKLQRNIIQVEDDQNTDQLENLMQTKNKKSNLKKKNNKKVKRENRRETEEIELSGEDGNNQLESLMQTKNDKLSLKKKKKVKKVKRDTEETELSEDQVESLTPTKKGKSSLKKEKKVKKVKRDTEGTELSEDQLENLIQTKNDKSSPKKKKKVKKVKRDTEETDLSEDQLKNFIQANGKKSNLKNKKKIKKMKMDEEATEDQLGNLIQPNNEKSSFKKEKKTKKVKWAEEIKETNSEPEEGKTDADETDCSPKKKKKLRKEILLQRYEPALDISEFTLAEVGKEKVKLNELIKSSQKLAGQVLVKKQLESAKKLKSLSVPLSRPQLEKIKRTVAYEKVCNEVSKWDTVVRGNRAAPQITFPLKKPELRLENVEEAAKGFVTKHPVQEAVSELLKTSDNNLGKSRELTPAEEKALQAMSLLEAKMRHAELMKHRALISQKELKARRQNKIKSKRYHRILKREKLKKMMKEFEELEKTDAAAALEKFLEADKLRVLERMTLKHRNTGKWAKLQKLRAKYNPESRSSLKEDLITGRHLREKVGAVDTIAKLKMKIAESCAPTDEEPDMSLIHNQGLEEDFRNDDDEDIEAMFQMEDELHDSLDTEEFPHVLDNHAIMKEPVNNAISRTVDNLLPQKQSSSEQKKGKAEKPAKKTENTKPSVEDDMDFSSEVTCLNSMVPDDITFGDEDLDDTQEERITIQQAFADEDFISEFKEHKKAAELANKPETINLFLPGWGSWGGPGIKANKRKKRRFIIKPVELPPKKDTLGSVILNEDRDKKAAAHQVSHLPFPFTNVHQFESYIRQPIGNTWNPQSSFQNLVAPKVITKIGKVIEPIEAEDAVMERKATGTVIVKKQKRKNKQRQLTAF